MAPWSAEASLRSAPTMPGSKAGGSGGEMSGQVSEFWRAVGDWVVLEPSAVASVACLPGLNSTAVGAGQAVLLNGALVHSAPASGHSAAGRVQWTGRTG